MWILCAFLGTFILTCCLILCYQADGWEIRRINWIEYISSNPLCNSLYLRLFLFKSYLLPSESIISLPKGIRVCRPKANTTQKKVDDVHNSQDKWVYQNEARQTDTWLHRKSQEAADRSLRFQSKAPPPRDKPGFPRIMILPFIFDTLPFLLRKRKRKLNSV